MSHVALASSDERRVALASSDERRVALVTGATGCIGYALAARLVQSGDYAEVRALVRPGHANGDVPLGVRCIAGTLDDADALQAATQNASVVFHCAAKVHDALGKVDDFVRVNVNGTKNLLDACAANNAISPRPPRFVFFSTVAVYGDATPPEGIAEDNPLNPQTPYAQSKVDAENLVAEWGKANRAAVYNLRVATVYGPRDRGNLGRMMDAILRNRFLLIGDGQNRKTCVAVQNAAHAAVALANQEKYADGTPVVVSDPAPYTLRELRDAMQTALCQAQQAPPVRTGGRALPLSAAVLLAGAATGAARLLNKKPPLTPEQARKIAQSNVYKGERLQQVDGYLPEVSLSQGMADAAQWLLQSREETSARESRATQ